MNTAEIENMSHAEKLHSIEKLWNALVNEESVESPFWHKDILAGRSEKVKSGKAQFISINANYVH